MRKLINNRITEKVINSLRIKDLNMNYRRIRKNLVDKYWNVESEKVDRICKKLNHKIYENLTNQKIKSGAAGFQYLCE